MEITVDVPDTKIGSATVETFNITKTEAKFANMRMSFSPGMGHRHVQPGEYKRLFVGGTLMMSNTRAEINDHLSFISEAHGDVLINGLGLGVCLKAILEKDKVKRVTVIEISQDVIDAVGPTYTTDPRVTIICGDALEYTPPKGKRYDCVWHDIWPHITADNWESMKKLHRKYGRRCDWQGSWCRDHVKYLVDRDRREARSWIW